MPEAGPNEFQVAIQAFYEQIDAARDHWANFVSAGEALNKSFSDLKLVTEMTKDGHSSYVRNKPAVFNDVDSAILSAGRLLSEFVASTQTAQQKFAEALKLSFEVADTEHHGDALMAGHEGMDSIVKQAMTAQQSWQGGLQEFMPQYRKFKLAAA